MQVDGSAEDIRLRQHRRKGVILAPQLTIAAGEAVLAVDRGIVFLDRDPVERTVLHVLIQRVLEGFVRRQPPVGIVLRRDQSCSAGLIGHLRIGQTGEAVARNCLHSAANMGAHVRHVAVKHRIDSLLSIVLVIKIVIKRTTPFIVIIIKITF